LPSAVCSLGVHPTELYAAVASGLTAGFLYAYWPRRRCDGQVFSLMLLMAGTMRFFEELLRADEGAAFPAISSRLTHAQWSAVTITVVGSLLLLFFSHWRHEVRPPVAE
jgi:phosphatidylglycerol:prolipoprotein diacylglycerol transferase